jgi:hypothetical protein
LEEGENAPLLPETLSLLDYLGGMSWDELEFLSGQDSCRIVSYRATPEPNLPIMGFRVAEADQKLLEFTGQELAGFEVLQVLCGGFQYQWRSDLSRAFEDRAPLVSRIYGLSGTRELVVEHLVVPLIRKHCAREIRGWFMFNQDLDACGGWASPAANPMFRRTEPPRPVRLPAGLWDPDRNALDPAGFFRAVSRTWRDSRGSSLV